MVLDTTVPVYAVGGEHPLAEPARDVVRAGTPPTSDGGSQPSWLL